MRGRRAPTGRAVADGPTATLDEGALDGAVQIGVSPADPGSTPVAIGRRGFLQGAAIGGLGLAALGVLGGSLEATASSTTASSTATKAVHQWATRSGAATTYCRVTGHDHHRPPTVNAVERAQKGPVASGSLV